MLRQVWVNNLQFPVVIGLDLQMANCQQMYPLVYHRRIDLTRVSKQSKYKHNAGLPF